MIRLGFYSDKAKAAKAFIKDYGIYLLGKETVDGDISFIEVENEELHETGLCSWGRENELRNCDEFMLLDVAEEHKRRRMRVKQRYTDDLAFWGRFTCDFVSRFGMVILNRYYDDVPQVDNGTIEVSLRDTDQQELQQFISKIDVNQMLLVRE